MGDDYQNAEDRALKAIKRAQKKRIVKPDAITLTRDEFERVKEILSALKNCKPIRLPTVTSCSHCHDMNGEEFRWGTSHPDNILVCGWAECEKEIPSKMYSAQDALAILSQYGEQG